MKIQQQPEDYPEDEEYLEEAEAEEYPPAADEENYIEDYTGFEPPVEDIDLDIYSSEPLNLSSNLPKKGKLKRSKSYDVLNVEMIEKKNIPNYQWSPRDAGIAYADGGYDFIEAF